MADLLHRVEPGDARHLPPSPVGRGPDEPPAALLRLVRLRTLLVGARKARPPRDRGRRAADVPGPSHDRRRGRQLGVARSARTADVPPARARRRDPPAIRQPSDGLGDPGRKVAGGARRDSRQPDRRGAAQGRSRAVAARLPAVGLLHRGLRGDSPRRPHPLARRTRRRDDPGRCAPRRVPRGGRSPGRNPGGAVARRRGAHRLRPSRNGARSLAGSLRAPRDGPRERALSGTQRETERRTPRSGRRAESCAACARACRPRCRTGSRTGFRWA